MSICVSCHSNLEDAVVYILIKIRKRWTSRYHFLVFVLGCSYLIVSIPNDFSSCSARCHHAGIFYVIIKWLESMFDSDVNLLSLVLPIQGVVVSCPCFPRLVHAVVFVVSIDHLYFGQSIEILVITTPRMIWGERESEEAYLNFNDHVRSDFQGLEVFAGVQRRMLNRFWIWSSMQGRGVYE